MTPAQQKATVERFDKKVNELRSEFPEKGKESKDHDFGYRTNEHDFIWTIPDWGKIKTHLLSEIETAVKEREEEIVGILENERPMMPYPNINNNYRRELEGDERNYDENLVKIITLIQSKK